MRKAWHVACIGEELCIQGYGGETEGKKPLGREGVDGKII